ncbi:hypothetical protein BJX62DRAFT_233347 [Aspergillus germanicus]
MVSVINVVTDFYVLLLPIPRLLKLHGLGACAASLARLINLSIQYHNPDKSWIQARNAQFSIAEMNIAIIVACATSLPMFFARVQSAASIMFCSAISLLHSVRSGSGSGSVDLRDFNDRNGPDRALRHWERLKDGNRQDWDDEPGTALFVRNAA